jgi:hypothetical protein
MFWRVGQNISHYKYPGVGFVIKPCNCTLLYVIVYIANYMIMETRTFRYEVYVSHFRVTLCKLSYASCEKKKVRFMEKFQGKSLIAVIFGWI